MSESKEDGLGKCGTCRHFSREVSRVSSLKYVEGIGECRRNAPRGPMTFGWSHPGQDEPAHRAIVSPFPFVPDDDWCGEYALLKARQG